MPSEGLLINVLAAISILSLNTANIGRLYIVESKPSLLTMKNAMLIKRRFKPIRSYFYAIRFLSPIVLTIFQLLMYTKSSLASSFYSKSLSLASTPHSSHSKNSSTIFDLG